jgi:[acyl-carrier-protein] S-malonyltransferase
VEKDARQATALVFPGMGPVGFADVARFMMLNPVARQYVAASDAVLGYSLTDEFEAAEGDYSEAAQVAFLVNCLALAEWAEQTMQVTPQVCAGVSFGGKAAAVHSGALEFGQAVLLTAELARYEHAYFAREHRDLVTHSFTRTPGERLTEILGELVGRGGRHDLSCHIDDDFYMVTLREKDIDWFVKRVRAAGGMNLYTMRPPMHSPALAGLRDGIEAELFGGLRFGDPRIPVVADQDGGVLSTGAEVRRMLLAGYVETVRWPKVVDTMVSLGVGVVHVCGPDSLFGRVRRTTEAFSVVAFDPARALRPRLTNA